MVATPKELFGWTVMSDFEKFITGDEIIAITKKNKNKVFLKFDENTGWFDEVNSKSSGYDSAYDLTDILYFKRIYESPEEILKRKCDLNITLSININKIKYNNGELLHNVFNMALDPILKYCKQEKIEYELINNVLYLY